GDWHATAPPRGTPALSRSAEGGWRKNPEKVESLASRVTGFRIGASVVESFQGSGPLAGALFAVHVQRQALLQVLVGPGAVDALLSLAKATVGPLHRVARRPQQLVIQEHQRLLQVRALQLVQALAQPPEAPHAPSQPLELRHGRLGPATAVEQPI